MSSAPKPQNKVVSHKDYTIKVSRLYDEEGYGYTEAFMYSKDGQVVFFESSAVLNPLSELTNNYKKKLDEFLETKFPKLNKEALKTASEKPKRTRKAAEPKPTPAPVKKVDSNETFSAIIKDLDRIKKVCQELQKSLNN